MLRMECPEHVDFIQRTLFKQKAFCLSIMITLVKKSPGRPFVQIISNDKKQIKDRSIVFLWSLERCWKRCEALYSYWEQMRKLKALVPNPISLETLYLINRVACHCFSQEPMVEGEKECSFSLWKRRAFKLSLKSPWKSLFWELVSTHMSYSYCTFPHVHLKCPWILQYVSTDLTYVCEVKNVTFFLK